MADPIVDGWNPLLVVHTTVAIAPIGRSDAFAAPLVPAKGADPGAAGRVRRRGGVGASLGIFVAAFLLPIALAVPRRQRVSQVLAAGADVAMLRGASGIVAPAWPVVRYPMVAKPF